MGRNGGLLSVALSRESPQTEVIRHPVLLEPGLSSGGHCDMTSSDPLSLWRMHPISLNLPRQGLLLIFIWQIFTRHNQKFGANLRAFHIPNPVTNLRAKMALPGGDDSK